MYIYRWYILPIGGFYATYHLLGEPTTIIDIELNDHKSHNLIWTLIVQGMAKRNTCGWRWWNTAGGSRRESTSLAMSLVASCHGVWWVLKVKDFMFWNFHSVLVSLSLCQFFCCFYRTTVSGTGCFEKWYHSQQVAIDQSKGIIFVRCLEVRSWLKPAFSERQGQPLRLQLQGFLYFEYRQLRGYGAMDS